MEHSRFAAIGALAPMLVILILLPFLLWMTVRVLHRAGYSGWWSLLTLIPVANIVAIWVFAFADWPALRVRS